MPAASRLLLLPLLLLLLGASSTWTAQATKILLPEGGRECISEELGADVPQVRLPPHLGMLPVLFQCYACPNAQTH